ncbi:MAG TPA: hypothetical protein VG269_19035 [Tepidisphaeraceae bacterium]|nr:hypothetical protein [Tepidisphaeraceae bacterium]
MEVRQEREEAARHGGMIPSSPATPTTTMYYAVKLWCIAFLVALVLMLLAETFRYDDGGGGRRAIP